MERILRGGQDYCVCYLKMDIGPFMHLSSIMRDTHLLVDMRRVRIRTIDDFLTHSWSQYEK